MRLSAKTNDFYFSKSRTPDEVSLFKNMNHRLHTFHQGVIDALSDDIVKVPSIPSREVDATLKGFAHYYTFNGVRAAPLLYFSDKLLPRIATSQAAGDITAEDAHALKSVLSISPLDPQKFSFTPPPHNIIGLNVDDSAFGKIAWQSFELASSNTIQKLLSGIEVSAPARQLAQQAFEEVKNDIDMYDHTIAVLGSFTQKLMSKNQAIHSKQAEEACFLIELANGSLSHDQPVFATDKERETFSTILSNGLSKLVINTDSQLMDEAAVRNAVDGFTQRVKQHDAKLIRGQEREAAMKAGHLARIAKQRAANEAKKDQNTPVDNSDAIALIRQQEALQRAQEKRLRYEAFMASPQPYEAQHDLSKKTIALLGGLAEGQGYKSVQAGIVGQAVETVKSSLDTRNKNISELGEFLLSPTSLRRVAKACGVEDALKTIPEQPVTSLNDRSMQLRLMYQASPEVKKAVDVLLTQEDAVLLIAQHTRGEEQCKKYAGILADTRRKLKPIEDEITVFKTKLTGFTSDELKEFSDDPDVKKLNAALAKESEARAKLDVAKQEIVDEIKQAFDGVPPRRISNHALPGVVIEKTELEQKIPHAWLKHLNGEYHLQESPQGEKFVAIHSNHFPDQSMQMKLNASEQSLADGLKQFEAQCEQHRVNLELMSQLSESAGFVLARDNQKPVLKQHDYTISALLAGDEIEQTKALLNAEALYEQRAFEQASLLKTAEQAGIVVERKANNKGGKGKTTLILPDKTRIELAPSGYFSRDEFDIVQNMLTQVGHSNGKGEYGAGTSAVESGTRQWKPDGEDTIIIFDANVLKRLTASRDDNGKTWLGLVKATALLPGIKVVIPEVVAMFEMLGKIPTEEHNGYVQVDLGYANGDTNKVAMARSIQRFFEGVAHGRVTEDGMVDLSGPNSNIIILSTPGDVDLYKKIHEKVLTAPESDHKKLLQEHIYYRGEGENAITRIYDAIPQANFAVITDDKNYVNDSGRAFCTTSAGKPIVYAGTGAYLDAEINASADRYRALNSFLNSKVLSVYQVCEDIVRAGDALDSKRGPVMVYFTSVRDSKTGNEVSLDRIIKKAAWEASHSKADGAWVDTVPRRLFAPEEMASRRNNAIGSDRFR